MANVSNRHTRVGIGPSPRNLGVRIDDGAKVDKGSPLSIYQVIFYNPFRILLVQRTSRRRTFRPFYSEKRITIGGGVENTKVRVLSVESTSKQVDRRCYFYCTGKRYSIWVLRVVQM